MNKKQNYNNDTSNIYLAHKFSKQHHISDAEGLRRAYNEPNRLYINGNRLYVAGTTWTDDRMNVSKPPLYTMLLKGLFPQTIPDNFSLSDPIDDLKIPLFKTQDIQRYKEAAEVLKNNPNIDQLVGHSMGSSVILQLNKDNNDKFTTRTYSAPVFDVLPHSNDDANSQRYRTSGDLVSIFDNNANTVYKDSLSVTSINA